MKHLICTFVSKITDDEDEDDDDDDYYYYYPDRLNCLYCPRVVFKYYHFIEDFSQSLRIDPSGSFSCLEVRQKYSAARRIFNSLLGVSSGDEPLRLMFDILHENLDLQKDVLR